MGGEEGRGWGGAVREWELGGTEVREGAIGG